MSRYTKESRWRMPPTRDSQSSVPIPTPSITDSGNSKAGADVEEDYSVSAFGDVSLTDAYVIPGTPSTKKPRLKLKHRKPPLPAKSKPDDKDTEQDDDPQTYSRSNFLDYLQSTSTKASEMTPTEDFINFFDTLKASRKSTQRQKHASSVDETFTKSRNLEGIFSSSGLTYSGTKSKARDHRSSAVKRRQPIPVWDQSTSNV